MDQAHAPLTATMIVRRRPLPFEPAVRGFIARPGLREDVRLFVFTYVAGLIAFLTWLG